jgi:hypothetical protein
MFNVETGLLTLIGPDIHMERTCKSGQQCGFSAVSGTYIADGDRVMIQNLCGGSQGIVPGWPDQGISDPAIFLGTEYSWGADVGGLHVTSAGGQYSLCWCSVYAGTDYGHNCASGQYFRTEMGILKLIGPATGQGKTCITGEACIIDNFGGYLLEDGDRIMISGSCMPLLSAFTPGFHDNSIFVASGGGSIYSNTNPITANGGIYSMCWCGFGSVCNTPANFQVDAGNLTVVGPILDQEKTCIASQVCSITNYQGTALSTNDRILILDTCGTNTNLQHMPNNALSTELHNFGHFVSWGPFKSKAAGGTYRLCWCSALSSCNGGGVDFIVDSGTLHHIGPYHFQQQFCRPGLLCTFEDFTGYGLQDGDRMMALATCGSGSGVPGFPNNALSNGATKDGKRFGWGSGGMDKNFQSLDTNTTGGAFKMCWCPLANNCVSPLTPNFVVNAGMLFLYGPNYMVDSLCAAGQSCDLGPWPGTLMALTDQIAFIPYPYDCMQADTDIYIANGEYKGVTCNIGVTECRATVSGVDSQSGGQWRICYCSTYTDPLGLDSDPCTESSEFHGWAGTLTIRGPYGGQSFPCAAGIECTINLQGFLLDVDDRIKLVNAQDPCNSEAVLGVEAQELLFASTGQSNVITPISSGSSTNKSFYLGKISYAGDYKVCYCSAVLPCINPFDFGGNAGNVEVAGADHTQVYVCNRGRDCTILLQGWRLGPSDMLKIIAQGGDCQDDQPTMGFVTNPATVTDAFGFSGTTQFLDATNTSSVNRFFVGRAIIGTQEQGCTDTDVNCGNRLCYCPNSFTGSGCTQESDYTHDAGALRITESIRSIEVDEDFVVTSFSIGILVDTAYAGGFVRCVAKEGEATDWGLFPDSSFFAQGPTAKDVAWGATLIEAIKGKNEVTLHLTKFLDAEQELRVWCYLSDSSTYVYPPDLQGASISVPAGMKKPTIVYKPSRGWHGSLHRFSIQDLLVQASRRLESAEGDEDDSLESMAYASSRNTSGSKNTSNASSTISKIDQVPAADKWQRQLQTITDVKVMTVMSTLGCGDVSYYDDEGALSMQPSSDALGNTEMSSQELSRVDTTMCMDDPSCAMITCFFGGPQEYAIKMNEQLPLINVPSLVTSETYRGARNTIELLKTNLVQGFFSWRSFVDLQSQGIDPLAQDNTELCPTIPDATSQNKLLALSEMGISNQFLLDTPAGSYLLCMLDDEQDLADDCPLNVVGVFEVRDVIDQMIQSASPSTRTTLRLDVFSLLPGVVTCVVKTREATLAEQETLTALQVTPGMSEQQQRAVELTNREKLLAWLQSSSGTMATTTVTVPESLPSNVTVVLVMNTFPTVTFVPTWCWHATTVETKITNPESTLGQEFFLPGDDPIAIPLPRFIWPGASFLIRVGNIPDTRESRVRLVNNSAECDASTYEEGVPVAQAGDSEPPIQAYMVADPLNRVVCFFELPTSMPMKIKGPQGGFLAAAAGGVQSEDLVLQSVLPNLMLQVDGALNEYIHRGLAANIMLNNVDGGEDAQVFIIPETTYLSNNGQCVPAIGIGAASDDAPGTEDYVLQAATVQFKDVILLPTAIGSTTHFVVITEADTENFVMGSGYTVCYVSSSLEYPRVFSGIGTISVRDIIVGIYKAPEAIDDPPESQSNSVQLRLQVLASMAGEINCMVCVKTVNTPPTQEEIRGDVESLGADFVPLFEGSEVLGRQVGVDATGANQNTSVDVSFAIGSVANIIPKPIGSAPEIYAWCYHERSSIIFPFHGNGVAVTLAVYPPPTFVYATASGARFDSLVLARSVTFPAFRPDWAVAGFPRFYFDSVIFSVTPPLPAGVSLPRDTGELVGDPTPEQLAELPVEFSINAQSKHDALKFRSTNLLLSVVQPGYCQLASVKSTEASIRCSQQDANNMYNQAIYLVISQTQGLSQEVSSFSCYGDAQTSPAAEAGEERNFVCKGSAQRDDCCCWFWLEGGTQTENRELGLLTWRTARVRAAECGLQSYIRYEVMTMAAGINPLEDESITSVIWDRVFDFTVPERGEDMPIQFTLVLDIPYENCDTPEEEAKCGADLENELTEMLGAPEGMIRVIDIEAA